MQWLFPYLSWKPDLSLLLSAPLVLFGGTQSSRWSRWIHFPSLRFSLKVAAAGASHNCLLYHQKLSRKPACWDLDFWQRGKDMKVGTTFFFFLNLLSTEKSRVRKAPAFISPCEDYLWTQEETQLVHPSGIKTQTGFSMLIQACPGSTGHTHGCHLNPAAAFSWRAFCGNAHLKRSSCLLILKHWGFSLDQFSVWVQHVAL